MNRDVTVIKKSYEGEEVWRYSGNILARSKHAVLLQAFFDRDDFLFNGMWLRKGDRFLEVYYSDRWYNIFEIHDHTNDHLKGWYCNITKPADIGVNSITYVDMALDLLVFPDGRQIVLDEDEFEILSMDAETQNRSLAALQELQILFSPPVQIVIQDLLTNPD